MELIRGHYNLRPEHRGCVVTIGNFDGVHLGHQAVLGQLAEQADALGLPLVVVTFEPQPAEYFQPHGAPPRLTRLREKIKALRRYSVDRVLVLRFNQDLATMEADRFIREVLIDGLDVRYLVVGDDFRFGRGRAGDFAMLDDAGKLGGFPVVHMHTFKIEGERVSSTRVRNALAAGEMSLAEQLLGRPYRICGRVAHGDKRGRTIGFPTANLALHRLALPVRGVYAVELFGLKIEPMRGVANVGVRPTVDGDQKPLLEVHLFDFADEIYGEHVQVDLLHRLRDEMKFQSFDMLKWQIERDCEHAREFFADINQERPQRGDSTE